MHVGRWSRRRAAAVAIGVSAALLAAACTSNTPTKKGSGGSGSATLVYAVPGVPSTLDYVPYEGNPNRYVDTPLKSTLVRYDPASLPDNGCSALAPISNIKGDLATSWSFSPDRKTITYKLSDAKSQYGNPLTADDVVWSVKRTIALSAVSQFDYFTITHFNKANPISKVDDKTVEMHVDTPTALDVPLLGLLYSTIYDSVEAKKHVTKDDPWAHNWLATHTDTFGPWQVASFTPSQSVTFEPNPNYTGKRGNITKLVIESVPDASTRVELLKSGEIDWAAALTFNAYNDLKKASGVTVKQCASPNRDDLVLNFADKKFKDVRVRQAISMALDRNAIIQGAYLGFGKPAITGLSQYYDYAKPTGDGVYSYDTAKAKSLLAAAGYPNGFDITLLYSPSRPGPQSAQSAIIVQSQLQKIGIKATLKQEAGATAFSNQFLGGNFDAVLWQEPPLIADPYFSAAIYNVSNSFQNHFGFASGSYDALVQQVGTTPSGDARNGLLTQLAAAGVTQYPVIYLVDDVYLQAYRSNISGYLAYPSNDLYPSEYTKN